MYELNGAWFEVTRHALDRAIDMTLDEDTIRAVLGDPRNVKPGRPGRELWTRGPITAVMEAREGYWAVITFMWATANGWAMDRERLGSRSVGLSADRMRAQRYAMKMSRRGRSVR